MQRYNIFIMCARYACYFHGKADIRLKIFVVLFQRERQIIMPQSVKGNRLLDTGIFEPFLERLTGVGSFTIKNYRSYRDFTELSFVASKKEGSKTKDLPPIWYKEINGKRILRFLL